MSVLTTRSTSARSQNGFTLMEIMATVAVVGVVVGMLLMVREGSANVAFRAHHMMEAMRLAEHHIARWALEPDTMDEQEGSFEDDREGIYRWVMTIEDFDLSTGRPIEEDEDDLDSPLASNYSDAAAPNGEGDGELDPYAVRRLIMRVKYPSPDGDEYDEILLETYLPALVDEEDSTNS